MPQTHELFGIAHESARSERVAAGWERMLNHSRALAGMGIEPGVPFEGDATGAYLVFGGPDGLKPNATGVPEALGDLAAFDDDLTAAIKREKEDVRVPILFEAYSKASMHGQPKGKKHISLTLVDPNQPRYNAQPRANSPDAAYPAKLELLGRTSIMSKEDMIRSGIPPQGLRRSDSLLLMVGYGDRDDLNRLASWFHVGTSMGWDGIAKTLLAKARYMAAPCGADPFSGIPDSKDGLSSTESDLDALALLTNSLVLSAAEWVKTEAIRDSLAPYVDKVA